MVTPLVALIILKRESLKVPWHWLHSKKKKGGREGRDAGGGRELTAL